MYFGIKDGNQATEIALKVQHGKNLNGNWIDDVLTWMLLSSVWSICFALKNLGSLVLSSRKKSLKCYSQISCQMLGMKAIVQMKSRQMR